MARVDINAAIDALVAENRRYAFVSQREDWLPQTDEERYYALCTIQKRGGRLAWIQATQLLKQLNSKEPADDR